MPRESRCGDDHRNDGYGSRRDPRSRRCRSRSNENSMRYLAARDRSRDRERTSARERSRDSRSRDRDRGDSGNRALVVHERPREVRGLGGMDRMDSRAPRNGSGRSQQAQALALVDVPCAGVGGGGTPGRRDMHKLLDEFRTKHIMPSDARNSRHIHVRIPDGGVRHLIDYTARAVAKYGEELEDAIRADVNKRGAEILRKLDMDRDSFDFLAKGADSPESNYYRWKTFTLVQGDRVRRWRTVPFQMCPNGTIWHPPAMPDAGGDGSESGSSGSHSRERKEPKRGSRSRSAERWKRIQANDSRSEERRRRKEILQRRALKAPPGQAQLEKRERKELSRLLMELMPQVAVIAEAMCWCLDRAECAIEISRILVESICETGLELPERVVRLLLVSDVVHNSRSTSATTAWCYRKEFETLLPLVFERLHVSLQAESSRLVAEKCRERVLGVLRSWQSKLAFTPTYVKGLEASFVRTVQPAEKAALAACKGGALDALVSKLREWRAQHFSQLEKVAKTRGLNWITSHIVDRAMDGRSPEELKTEYLLDRLINYEIHAWETRPREAPKRAPTKLRDKISWLSGSGLVVLVGGSSDDQSISTSPGVALPTASTLLDADVDGESFSSGDEAFVAAEERHRQAKLLDQLASITFSLGCGDAISSTLSTFHLQVCLSFLMQDSVLSFGATPVLHRTTPTIVDGEVRAVHPSAHTYTRKKCT